MPQGIHGVILLDKPAGITSQTAVTQVKRLMGADKAGHTGTLDPMASGVVLILTGSEYFNKERYIQGNKTYNFDILFGFEIIHKNVR